MDVRLDVKRLKDRGCEPDRSENGEVIIIGIQKLVVAKTTAGAAIAKKRFRIDNLEKIQTGVKFTDHGSKGVHSFPVDGKGNLTTVFAPGQSKRALQTVTRRNTEFRDLQQVGNAKAMLVQTQERGLETLAKHLNR